MRGIHHNLTVTLNQHMKPTRMIALADVLVPGIGIGAAIDTLVRTVGEAQIAEAIVGTITVYVVYLKLVFNWL
jgi:flagellar motor component MotA